MDRNGWKWPKNTVKAKMAKTAKKQLKMAKKDHESCQPQISMTPNLNNSESQRPRISMTANLDDRKPQQPQI